MARVYTLKSFRRAVTTAGVAVPLSDTPRTYTNFLRVYALGANTGDIYVGDSDVDDQAEPLAATEGKEISQGSRGLDVEAYDLNRIYIDADTAGEGVIVTYQAREEA